MLYNIFLWQNFVCGGEWLMANNGWRVVNCSDVSWEYNNRDEAFHPD